MRTILLLIFIFYSIKVIPCECTIFGDDRKPPKSWVDKNRIPKGILVDMIKYIGKDLNCNFPIELTPWARAYHNALKGHGCIIGLSKSNERLKIFDYSNTMYVDQLLLVVKKGKEFSYAHINDLKGKRVGIMRDSRYGNKFETAVKDNLFTIVEDNHPISRFKMLLYDRTDVLIIGPGRQGVETIINSDNHLIKNRDKFVILPRPFLNDSNYMGILKSLNKNKFLDRFNKSLQKGKESGAFEEIIKKYRVKNVL